MTSNQQGSAQKPNHPQHTIEAIVAAGAIRYERAKNLPRLLPKIALSDSKAQIIQGLQNELRKTRAKSGHWSYDLNLHISLLQALRAETAKNTQ